jgi:hypothetical protein
MGHRRPYSERKSRQLTSNFLQPKNSVWCLYLFGLICFLQILQLSIATNKKTLVNAVDSAHFARITIYSEPVEQERQINFCLL